MAVIGQIQCRLDRVIGPVMPGLTSN